MDLSIVDLSHVPEGSSATEAYEQTVELAQLGEDLGYERFWVAEHHGMAGYIAGTTPEVLLGHLAAETESIRLGSGTVLLNYYQPYKVAESFSVLDSLAPGRIDMGLGRATGPPAADRAMGYDSSPKTPEEADSEHRAKVQETLRHALDEFGDDHPYSGLQLARSAEDTPEPWLLGSSPSSAKLAGELGLRYCFAGFIRPQFAEPAFDAYREAFTPSPIGAGPDEPAGMLAINAVCAETDEKAARLRAPTEAVYQRMARGTIGDGIPPIETAIDELGGVPDHTPNPLPEGEWSRSISGSPKTIDAVLTQLTDRVGVDDVIVQHTIPDFDDAKRSHELLAEGVGI
ncbi:luciferase family oxidoreductase, group 1 [Halovivax asiaticus JCM 14624]|uniref:Luciferase family oxidoreductase, group 1 n=1 Tax=Halovivax asiaticus JCM 14624 TaxID=1227490 RepID=M0BKV8_9EURY|nr:LLM class flavin-dependent oxidoreductase [Halovivax asiaticus]ELZ10943.1 luciferase family oxidoreductase, group 1 [Halovivax asiaticus JCM 14624]